MRIRDWVLKNRLIFALFLISTAFFVWQHSTGISWDFSVYVLNGKYLLDQSEYFEWTRPPLAQFTLASLSVFSWQAAEYVYIILVSMLFLFSVIRFSKNFCVDEKILYLLLLNPFLLIKSFFAGTELLSLSLLMLAVSYSSEKNMKSFLFMGLAFLARYTNLIFLPLLFSMNYKHLLFGAVVFFIVLAPWLAYNYFASGDALTSFMNYYAPVQSLTNQLGISFSVSLLIGALNYLLPIMLFSIFLRLKQRNFGEKDFAMLLFFLISLASFYIIPVKDIRYLFPAILPAAYFSTFIIKSSKLKAIFFITIILIALVAILYPSEVFLSSTYRFSAALQNLDNCGVKSNAWIYLNYFDRTTEPLPYLADFNHSISQGYRILLFKGVAEQEYVNNKTFISQFPVKVENENFVMLGEKDKCVPIIPADSTYIKRLSDYTERHFNYRVESNACKIFLPWICGGSRI